MTYVCAWVNAPTQFEAGGDGNVRRSTVDLAAFILYASSVLVMMFDAEY